MRRRPQRSPEVETLENLVLLSNLPGPAPAAEIATTSAPLSVVPGTKLMSLTGTIRGTYQLQAQSADKATLILDGRGTLRGVGPVRLQARTDASGNQPMDVTLTNRRGSLMVRISVDELAAAGSSANGPSPARYHILGGTGAYQNASGTGSIQMGIFPRLASLGLAGTFNTSFRTPSAGRAA
jgi:hypothetical protein